MLLVIILKRLKNQRNVFQRLASGHLSEHQVKTMTVAVKVLCLEVSSVLPD